MLARLWRRLQLPSIRLHRVYDLPLTAERPALSSVSDLLEYGGRVVGLRPEHVIWLGPSDRFQSERILFPHATHHHVAQPEALPALAERPHQGANVLVIRLDTFDPDDLGRSPLRTLIAGCEIVAWETDIPTLEADPRYLTRSLERMGAAGFTLLEIIGGRSQHRYQPDGRCGQVDLVFSRETGHFCPWGPGG